MEQSLRLRVVFWIGVRVLKRVALEVGGLVVVVVVVVVGVAGVMGVGVVGIEGLVSTLIGVELI
jgi:hypothetical protein